MLLDSTVGLDSQVVSSLGYNEAGKKSPETIL